MNGGMESLMAYTAKDYVNMQEFFCRERRFEGQKIRKMKGSEDLLAGKREMQ